MDEAALARRRSGSRADGGRWPEARGQTARRQKNRCFQGVWAVSAGGQSILTDAVGPAIRPVFRACADALQ